MTMCISRTIFIITLILAPVSSVRADHLYLANFSRGELEAIVHAQHAEIKELKSNQTWNTLKHRVQGVAFGAGIIVLYNLCFK